MQDKCPVKTKVGPSVLGVILNWMREFPAACRRSHRGRALYPSEIQLMSEFPNVSGHRCHRNDTTSLER